MLTRDTSKAELKCYRCGGSLARLSLPLARLDLCPHCSVELHVCRMCLHYAPARPEACSEDDAVEVRNKQAANFCDYFQPNFDSFDGVELRAESAARQHLDALFGDDSSATGESADAATTDETLAAANKLFQK